MLSKHELIKARRGKIGRRLFNEFSRSGISWSDDSLAIIIEHVGGSGLRVPPDSMLQQLSQLRSFALGLQYGERWCSSLVTNYTATYRLLQICYRIFDEYINVNCEAIFAPVFLLVVFSYLSQDYVQSNCTV